jgi:hypothetical protein
VEERTIQNLEGEWGGEYNDALKNAYKQSLKESSGEENTIMLEGWIQTIHEGECGEEYTMA